MMMAKKCEEHYGEEFITDIWGGVSELADYLQTSFEEGMSGKAAFAEAVERGLQKNAAYAERFKEDL